MTPNHIENKIKGTPHVILPVPNSKSQISFRFAVRWLLLEIIEVFGFPMYNHYGKFEFFANKLFKNSTLKKKPTTFVRTIDKKILEVWTNSNALEDVSF